MLRLSFLTWFLIVAVASLFVYEFIAAFQNATGHDPLTISQLIWRGSELGPFLPFAFGVLMGHLFAPRKVTA
jgi:hypothetical protein